MSRVILSELRGPRGPVGAPGPDGLPGVNAVPADAAVAGYLSTDGTSATKTAMIAGGSVLNALHGGPGGVVAAQSTDDHTTFLRSVLASAVTFGIGTVVIPQLDPADASKPWVLSDQLEPAAGITVDARRARIKQTVFDRPAFYVAPHVDDVTIHAGYCYLDTGAGRPVWSDYDLVGTINGATARASDTGIMSYGARGTFTGHFSGFRNGVRLAHWSGVGTVDDELRVGNNVDILVDSVDFGLVFVGQNGMDANVRGSYMATVGTPDPPHLIYGTDGLSRSCSVNGDAWDSTDGVAFSLKGQDNLTCGRLTARNCPAVVIVVNPTGSLVIGEIHGSALTTVVNVPVPESVEAIRGTVDIGGMTGSKQIGSARISFADGVPVGNLRAASLDEDWMIGQLDIQFNTNEVSVAQSLVHVYGARSVIGQVKARNLGSGGVQGIRYTGVTNGHLLNASPLLTGVTNGVVIDSTVYQSVFTVDEQTITPLPTYRPLVFTPDNSNVIRGGGSSERPYSTNRWYAYPPAVTLTTISPVQSVLYGVPLVVQRARTISKLAVEITTAAASNVIRLGVFRDSGFGRPAGRLLDAGTVSAGTIGLKELALATPLTLQPGTYWLAYVLQGGTGAAVRGVNAAILDAPAATSANAMLGSIPVIPGVTGALPDPFGSASDSVLGIARLGYMVP